MSPLFDDTDEDVTLPRRGDAQGVRSARELDRTPADREFTLNTGIVLALFFALALLCAVFFGFGYSIGHKSVPPAPVISDNTPTGGSVTTSTTSSVKPSPGTVAVPEYVPSSTAATHPAPAATSATPRTIAPTDATTAPSKPAPVVRVAPAPPVAVPAMAAAPAGGVSTYVQVAAVSHQEDADVLLSSLRRRGYTVMTRTDANDHLIHVQIGPFPTRKDGETMRQKLMGDGYNAILK